MRQIFKGAVSCACAFGALLLVAYFFRAPILRGLADAWIVNDKLEKADAIVVLGGGLDTRPFEAARLFQQGLAPRILLLNVRSNYTDELGITLPHTHVAKLVLFSNQVPPEAVIEIGNGVMSTRDESLAVQGWVKASHAKRLIIPTDLFHTRRVKWLFHKALNGTSVDIRTEAVASSDYTAANYWQHEEGLLAFQNEVLKFAYYVVKY
ncbi:MAG: YdcF family protein [Verrucomicrobiota bacterium]